MPRTCVFVEIGDELVPHRNRILQRFPESGVLAAVEVLDGYALLLDPGVVTEIENALAVDVSQLAHVIVHDAAQVLPENLPGVDFIEAICVTARDIAHTFARVERSAV